MWYSIYWYILYDISDKNSVTIVYPSLQDTTPHAVNLSLNTPEDGQKVAQNMLS